ncbi:PAS domain S-box protein [Synechocystis sp. FACHB-383]|nr:PAS domain S-box protein [Synechocystis sp. FACHB-383]
MWFSTQAVAQRDENGRIQRWLGSSIDIDDLRRFREESERIAAKFRHTVESITDALFTLDHDFRFTYLNQKAAEILGGTVEDLLGEIIWRKCSIGYHSSFAVWYRRAAQTGQKLHFEEYFPPDDKWLEVRIYPSPDGLSVYFSDISERRKEREQLRLLNIAVSKLNDIILITEAEPLDEPGPKIVYVNPAFEKLTGYTSQEIIGRSPRLLQGPQTDPGELSRIKTALENKDSVRAQLINYTKTGKQYCIELEIIPLLDDKMLCTHLVSVQRDITARIQMEQRLRESQKLEAVGHLTGGVAHDFNNLLTIILGNAEMLSELVAEPSLQSMAQMTLSAANRGAELTRHLLAFARRQPLDPKVININHLVEAMWGLIRRALPENIELEFVPDPDLGITEIDAGELETALLNLVVNARDAMQDGGKLTIETSTAVLDSDYADRHSEVITGEYVMICVSDTGIGMDTDTVSHAFEPFFTTKTVGKGSGLGLSMVFGFTKQSGGHIKIYSEPGEGTAVKLYFPMVRGAQQVNYQPTQESLPEGGPEHILIAEDDDLVLKHLEAQLRSLGYRVTAVTSGPDALKVLGSHNDIELLLTDIIMPGGMNGRELADRAKAMYPKLKILFTSGYTDNAIVHNGRLDPGVELLSKPYNRLELATKVRQVLSQKR